MQFAAYRAALKLRDWQIFLGRACRAPACVHMCRPGAFGPLTHCGRGCGPRVQWGTSRSPTSSTATMPSATPWHVGPPVWQAGVAMSRANAFAAAAFAAVVNAGQPSGEALMTAGDMTLVLLEIFAPQPCAQPRAELLASWLLLCFDPCVGALLVAKDGLPPPVRPGLVNSRRARCAAGAGSAAGWCPCRRSRWPWRC